MDSLKGAWDFVSGLFGGGTVGIVLKIVLGVLVLGGGIFFMIWFEEMRRKLADKATQQGRAKDQAGAAEDNRQTFDPAKKSVATIEEEIAKRGLK